MQKLQLSIPEPCQENWQQMTPTQQGRFCNACAKEVVDFSTMTDIQVLNYFTNLTHEKVCGRALPEQLDRTISRPAQPKKRLFWYWNYFVMFFMFFAKGNNAKAQSCTKPATELSPVTNMDVRGDVVVKGETQINNKQHVVSGKITDKDGNVVSFASIRVKGTNTGISADANGAYSITINPHSILEISGAGFETTEIHTDNGISFNTILEKRLTGQLGAVVVTGGIFWRDPGEYYGPLDKSKRVAVIQVKDETTGMAIPNTNVIIKPDFIDITDTIFSNKKGEYKIKGIKEDDGYFIKILADGYESNEFTIDANDFKDRKKEWKVLLRKRKAEPVKPLLVKPGTQTTIRLGGMIAVNKSTEPLYIVDGIITKKAGEIKPEDIDDIKVVKGSEAAALFGTDGVNGAIVITTKKIKAKILDTVTVTSDNKKIIICTSESTSTVMGAAIKGVSVKNTITDSLKMIANKITGDIKIYPNPVQRGNTLSISLKLKQTGFYQLQITDATGRIILQKQINAVAKEHTEAIVTDARWSSGACYVSIIDNKNKLISSTSFIFE